LFLGPWGLFCGGLGLAVVDPGAGLAIALGALLVRQATAEVARRLAGRRLPRPPIRDLVAADALLACAFVSALRARGVTWAGRHLPLRPNRPPLHESTPHAPTR
jgi:hypothetical protein